MSCVEIEMTSPFSYAAVARRSTPMQNLPPLRTFEKYIESIKGEMRAPFCFCPIGPFDYSPGCTSLDFRQWEAGIRRLALNTFVNEIILVIKCKPEESGGGVIDALLKLNAGKLKLLTPFVWDENNMGNMLFELPSFDLSRLLTLAQNVREVTIRLICTSLTAQDFYTIRKAMVEFSCRMEKFFVLVPDGTDEAVLDVCFGVTIEKVYEPSSRTYLAKDESIELYSHGYPGTARSLRHFEGHLESQFDREKNRHESVIENCITFVRHESEVKPDHSHFRKVRFNCRYC